jgi:phage tail sheath protein FI
MPTYATPAVYYETADTGSAAVSPLRTDIAGFVGMARRGPLHTPVALASWRQFLAYFGGFTGAAYLAYAVRAFFENGGQRCWVVRIASPAAMVADATLTCAAPGSAWRIAASSPGVWGNDLDISLRPTRRAQTRGRFSAAAPEYAEVASVAGFVRALHVRIAQGPKSAVFRVISHVDSDRKRLYWVHPDPRCRLPYDAAITGFDASQPLLIESLEYTLLVHEQGRLIGLYEGLSLVPEHGSYGPRVLAVIDRQSFKASDAAPAAVAIEELRDSAAIRQLQPLDAADGIALRGGADGLALLGVHDFVGEAPAPFDSDSVRAQKRLGLRAFDDVAEVAIVAIPDIHIQAIAPPQWAAQPPCLPDPCLPPPPPGPASPRAAATGDLPPRMSEGQIYAVQAALLEHCETHRDRIALIDPPYALARDGRLGIDGIRAWRCRFDSKYAAMYFPWLRVEDPLRATPALMRDMPPSGHVAGFFAKTDLGAGVHKAPANGALGWVQEVTIDLNDTAHAVLNDENINAVRACPGRGIRIVGARTVSSAPDWRYVNVRRLLMMIEKTIAVSCQWAVFEPNSTITRAKLHMALTSFLLALWQRGAMAGASADAAFFVNCSEQNNPVSARERGELLAEIGVAPAIPFEFVVLRVGRTCNEFEIAELESNGGTN